ncbi:MAG TPA: ATP-binding protein [Chitinophagaceae bacterium]|nr:ATP-binding protein [Chitinophagaceae bacterium]
MYIPDKLLKILEQDQSWHRITLSAIATFGPILIENRLYFFEEYTDHGIEHIESILKTTELLIPNDTFQTITSKEVSIYIISVIIHDIGMQLEFSTFINLINGKYDSYLCEELDSKSWNQLWHEYLNEIKVLGSIKYICNESDIHSNLYLIDSLNKDQLTGEDKKIIGEFIRRHHPRIAYEIALGGIIGNQNQKIEIPNEINNELYKRMIGIIARSHGMKLRETFDYLEENFGDAATYPNGIRIIYLMSLLRITDYLQIDITRINPIVLKVKTLANQISASEHDAHLAIKSINSKGKDKEKIYIHCEPKNSIVFNKLIKLFQDIQNELDQTWAVLDEVYSYLNEEKPKLAFRRLNSNLNQKEYLSKLPFVYQKVDLKFDSELSKLLISPLYGKNPIFGVRELLQNAIDSCLERSFLEKQKKNSDYYPEISLKLDQLNKGEYLFKITDNGKGMSVNEIMQNYLTIGFSSRQSNSFKLSYLNSEGNTLFNKTGKFGIGVLATFLLGESIKIETNSMFEKKIYCFELTLKEKNINISKHPNSKQTFGTSISVIISKQTFETLQQNPIINWTDLFVEHEPKIHFSINNQQIVPKIKFKNCHFASFQTKDFKEVKWSYGELMIGNKEYRNNFLIHNGFVFPKGLMNQLGKFKFPVDNNNTYAIENIPGISVLDSDGKFPFTLDRNHMDTFSLPFEKDLYKEVCKFQIANMLNLKFIKANGYLSTGFIDNFNANILWTKNGYAFNIDYFMKQIANSFYAFKFVAEKNLMVECLFDIKNSIFKIGSKSELDLSSHKHQHLIKYKMGYEKKQLLKAKDPFQSRIIYTRNKEEKDEITYSTQRFNLYGAANQYFIDLTNQMESLYEKSDNFLPSLAEFNLNQSQVLGGAVFNNLLKYYFGENVIIPYEMDLRKAKYAKAFHELGYYLELSDKCFKNKNINL